MAAAGNACHPRGHCAAGMGRNGAHIDALDIAVDHHDAQRTAIDQRLRRDRNACQHKPRAGLRSFNPRGGLIDLCKRDRPPLQQRDQSSRLRHQLGETALNDDFADPH